MIWLGPAGNCITAKEKGTEGSLKRVKELGLNAQEIEFVRSIYLKPEAAKRVGELAKELGIKLSVHAPYYINLASEKASTVEASKRMILEACDRAFRLEAEGVVIHSAYYGKNTPEKTFELVRKQYGEIVAKLEKAGIGVKLLPETMPSEKQWGTLEEIFRLRKEVGKQIEICVDWAHLFCRNQGKINYAEIFDKLKKAGIKKITSHFSNMKYNVKTKKFVDVHVQINSHPNFKELAKEILKRKVDITIISESPVLEKDSMKMKQVLEKLSKGSSSS